MGSSMADPLSARLEKKRPPIGWPFLFQLGEAWEVRTPMGSTAGVAGETAQPPKGEMRTPNQSPLRQIPKSRPLGGFLLLGGKRAGAVG